MIKRFVAGLLMAVAAGLAMAQTPEGAVVDTIAQKFRASPAELSWQVR